MTTTISKKTPQYYTPQEIQAGFAHYVIQSAQYWSGDFPTYKDRFNDTEVWLKFANEMIGPFLNAVAGRPAGPLPQHEMRLLPNGPAFNSCIDVINKEGQAIHNINYGSLNKVHFSEVDDYLERTAELDTANNTPYHYRMMLLQKLRTLALKAHYSNIPNEEKCYHFMRNILWFLDKGDDEFATIILTASHTSDVKDVLVAQEKIYINDITRYSSVGTTLVEQFDQQRNEL